MADDFTNKGEMPGQPAEGHVENPGLPSMGVSSTGGAMDADAQPSGVQAQASEQSQQSSQPPQNQELQGQPEPQLPTMDTGEPQPVAMGAVNEFGDQQPQARLAADPAEGYLRIQMAVENGQMTVVSIKEVGGPLIESDSLQGNFAYEVTVGESRVIAGSVPDMGEWRSYASPAPQTRTMAGHHITALKSAEFTVRVPKKRISLSALPEAEVVLYRVKQPTPDARIGPSMALAAQSGQELREVARLKGIRLESLPAAAQTELLRALE